MPTRLRRLHLVTTLVMLAGCSPAPGHAPATTHQTFPSTDGTVLVGATTPAGSSGQPSTMQTSSTPTQGTGTAPIEVKAPVISNNGASVLHGTVRIPASILANNGGNIVSPNGGTIVSPNGGTIVSPNGGTTVSPNGGTIVSPNGGTIVSPNGGTIIANNGAGLKLSQVPMRFAEVKLTDATGAPVMDGTGKEILTKTDSEGNYHFPVDVRGRNLVVHVVVPGQSSDLLGLVSKDGATSSSNVDLNSTMSLSYVLQKYVNGDVSVFERLQAPTFAQAVVETDNVLSSGKVMIPTALGAEELAKKVDQIRLTDVNVNSTFSTIRKQLILVGIQNEGDGLNALAVNLGDLSGCIRAQDGSIFLYSRLRHVLWKVDSKGSVHTILSDRGWGYSPNFGNALPILLTGMCIDKNGYLYIADSIGNRVVRVSPEDEVVTVAGTGKQGYGGDEGAATDAQLNSPTGLFLTAAGELLVSDTGNNRIRRIDSSGVIRTIIGDGGDGEDLDSGVIGGAHLKGAQGIVGTNDGELYITDGGHHRIMEIGKAGTVTRVVNDLSILSNPVAIAIRGKDLIIIDTDVNDPLRIVNGVDPASSWSSALKRVTYPGNASNVSLLCADDKSILIGSGRQFLFEGTFESQFLKIFGVNAQDSENALVRGVSMTVDLNGTVYVVDQFLGRVYKQTIGGILTPIAGLRDAVSGHSPYVTRDFDDALKAPLDSPRSIFIESSSGDILITVGGSPSSIRRITKSGALKVEKSDFKVKVTDSNSVDKFIAFSPNEILGAPNGEIFLSASAVDGTGRLLVRQLRNGEFELVQGTYKLKSIECLSLDKDGVIYFIDNIEQIIYKVVPSGLVPVLAVDSILGREFGRVDPQAFVRSVKGDFYISEGSHIYRVSMPSKNVTLIAGQGAKYFSGNARDQSFASITSLKLSPNGDLYILDRDQVKFLASQQLNVIP